MLLVGTQPLRSQHSPLTPLPLGSAIPPRRLETNLQVDRTMTGFSQPGVRHGGHVQGKCGDRWMSLFFGSKEERERGREKSGGNITLASPPSRRFLTRPHCVLLPHKLSLSPAPTSYVPDCCSCFFFFLFLLIHLFYCTLRMTQALYLNTSSSLGLPDE